MKDFFNVDKLWNKMMAVIGTPIIVFMALVTCGATAGFTPVAMSMFFAFGVLCGAPNVPWGVCETLIGLPLFMVLRDWFLVPLNLPFFGTFKWWGHQTACAGTISIILVMMLMHLVVSLATKNKHKKSA